MSRGRSYLNVYLTNAAASLATVGLSSIRLCSPINSATARTSPRTSSVRRARERSGRTRSFSNVFESSRAMRDVFRRRGAASGSEDQFRAGISSTCGIRFGGSAETSARTVDSPQPPAPMARNAAHEPERTRRTTRRMYCRTGIPPFRGSTGNILIVCQKTVFVIIRTIGYSGKYRPHSGSIPGREQKEASLPVGEGRLLCVDQRRRLRSSYFDGRSADVSVSSEICARRSSTFRIPSP